jgi:hypothetical protein
MLFFAGVIKLLVVVTNHCYHEYMKKWGDGPSPPSDMTGTEMFILWPLGRDLRNRLTLLVRGGIFCKSRLCQGIPEITKTVKCYGKLETIVEC